MKLGATKTTTDASLRFRVGKFVIRKSSLLLLIMALLSCSESEPGSTVSNNGETTIDSASENASEDSNLVARWYNEAQQQAGSQVFAQNCALCHGDTAQGLTADWREKLADGSFPPPPLNGSAHAWHHPQAVLLQVIDNGGEAFGGKMPAFATVLEQSEKLEAIAYFQSFWSDEIYSQWEQMGGTN